MEYFVIGERELVIAFKLVGIEGAVAVNRNEALASFNKITGRDGVSLVPVAERPKVLILTEDVSSMLEEEVFAWQRGAEYPLIVEIPGIRGHIEGKKSLSDAIRDAIGIQV